MPNDFVGKLFIIGFVLTCIITLFFSQFREKAALRNLSAHFTGRICGFSLFPCFCGIYQGLKFCINLVPASKQSPSYLEIFLIKSSSFRLKIYKESELSNFGKKIGIIRETKIKDSAFDKDYLIFSNRHDQVISYLDSETIKDAIKGLFNINFDTLSIANKKVMARKPYYSLKHDLAPQNITDILNKLFLLTQRLAV